VEHRSHKHEIAVGGLLLVALTMLVYMSVQVGALRLDARSVRVSALFDNVAGLASGAVVSVAGVEVGKVDALAVEDGRARLNLVLSERAGLRKNIGLRIRARSMLGEKYLEVVTSPEDAPLLTDGDVILKTQGQVDMDQMVDSMSPLFRGADPEMLSRALNALAEALARDPERADRILTDTEALLHNLRVASEDAPALVADARQAVQETRHAVSQARPMIERADRLLTELNDLSTQINAAAEDLPGLVGETRQAVSEARATLSHLDNSTADLGVVLHNLRDIDKQEIRRWLREEGVLIRLREKDVDAGQLATGGVSVGGGVVGGSP
jgi:phospholipid/cholesterol/gamma-HCH transport system substrate-binding protein